MTCSSRETASPLRRKLQTKLFFNGRLRHQRSTMKASYVAAMRRTAKTSPRHYAR